MSEQCIATYAGCARELPALQQFRSRVLAAFVAGRISCDCAGICHDDGCPLGDLEVEADSIWRESLPVVHIADSGDVPAVAECPACNGNGLVVGWNKAVQSHTVRPCPDCGGTGQQHSGAGGAGR